MGPRTYHDISNGAGGHGMMLGKLELLQVFPQLEPAWDAVAERFPVRVTRSWWARARALSPDDPLLAQVLPSASELEAVVGDLDDPVGDRLRSPMPWVVHKHPDRVLLLLTKRCHIYCRYCFRRTHTPGDAEDPDEQAWEAAMQYAVSCGAREAILSGGDPLAVRDERLFATIDRLRDGGIRVIRLHTRAPISAPSRVTDALVQGLAERGPCWVVVHCNHPDELSPDVDEALARLIDAGIPVLNQSVLLRGVNDDVEVLEALCHALVERRVRPYYLHHTDPVTGNAAFRVELDRGLAMYRALRRRVSGISVPRYVIDPPDGSGKVDVEAFVRGEGGSAPT
jgi:lysine 2,3-aminomutase